MDKLRINHFSLGLLSLFLIIDKVNDIFIYINHYYPYDFIYNSLKNNFMYATIVKIILFC